MRKPNDIRVKDTVYTPEGSLYKVVGSPSLLRGGTLRVLTPEEVRELKEGDIVVDVRDGAECSLSDTGSGMIWALDACDDDDGPTARGNINHGGIHLTNTFALKSLAEPKKVEPNLPWTVVFEDAEEETGWIRDAEGHDILYFDFDTDERTAPQMIVEAVNASFAPPTVIKSDPQGSGMVERYTVHSVPNGWRIRDNQRNMYVTYPPFTIQEEAMVECRKLNQEVESGS